MHRSAGVTPPEPAEPILATWYCKQKIKLICLVWGDMVKNDF